MAWLMKPSTVALADEAYYTVDGEPYCVSCYELHFIQCYNCNEPVKVENAIRVHVYEDEVLMCESCANTEKPAEIR